MVVAIGLNVFNHHHYLACYVSYKSDQDLEFTSIPNTIVLNPVTQPPSALLLHM